jgi:hypothetical protein
MHMYQKRHGRRLDVQKYGFRNAVEAMKSLPGVVVTEGVLNAQPTFTWEGMPEGDYEARHRQTVQRREERQREYEMGLEHVEEEFEELMGVMNPGGSLLPQ